MADQHDLGATEDTTAPLEGTGVASTATLWLGGAGLLFVALGIWGTVVLMVEMAGDEFGDSPYSTVDRWLGVLTASMVTGLGVIICAVAVVVARLDENRKR